VRRRGGARRRRPRLYDPLDRLWLGTALETLVYHELRVHNHVQNKNRPIAFYRTPAGAEIDFVIETRKRTTSAPPRVVCMEIKLAEKWDRRWERSMRNLHQTKGIEVERMIGVYTGGRAYHYDGLEVWPLEEFLRKLHAGEVF
jgi:hypothetical protein